MWSAMVDDDACGPAPGRYSAPDNELPVALPVDLLLARTDDVAVAITRLHVYSVGVSLELVVRLRPSGPLARDDRLNELLWHGRGSGRGFLFGIGFADGRRVSNLRGDRGTGDGGTGDGGTGDGVVLVSGSGSGGMSSVEQSWWLHPLPPEGPMTVAVRCDELGIEESLAELDGTAVRRAAERVVTFWPWEPPPAEALRDGPSLPPVPPDSWFAAG